MNGANYNPVSGLWTVRFRKSSAGYEVKFSSLSLEEATAAAEEKALLKAMAKEKAPVAPRSAPRGL